MKMWILFIVMPALIGGLQLWFAGLLNRKSVQTIVYLLLNLAMIATLIYLVRISISENTSLNEVTFQFSVSIVIGLTLGWAALSRIKKRE